MTDKEMTTREFLADQAIRPTLAEDIAEEILDKLQESRDEKGQFDPEYVLAVIGLDLDKAYYRGEDAGLIRGREGYPHRLPHSKMTSFEHASWWGAACFFRKMEKEGRLGEFVEDEPWQTGPGMTEDQ